MKTFGQLTEELAVATTTPSEEKENIIHLEEGVDGKFTVVEQFGDLNEGDIIDADYVSQLEEDNEVDFVAEAQTYKVPVEVGPPGGGISVTKHLHVEARSPEHAKTVARKHVKERGHKLYGIGPAVVKEDADVADDLEIEPLNESGRSVDEAYAEHTAAIHEHIKGIQAGLKAHGKGAKNWGHVGDLGHYRELLQRVHHSLTGQGEHAD